MSIEEQRIERLREALQEQRLDAMLVSHPTNRRYITGFTAEDMPPDESAGHLLITSDGAVLVTGSVNVTQARTQAPHVEVISRTGTWARAIAPLIIEHDVHRVGYEPMAILEGVFSGIVEAIQDKGVRVEWVPVGGTVEALRLSKDPHEIELLKQAFAITCDAFNAVQPTIAAGDTEHEIAWRLHTAMVERGAEGLAFPIIVAAGANAARPHHEPGETVIAAGQPIVIDMGARYAGYCADLTRTVWVGKPDEKLTEIYPIVASAVEQVFEHAHPGKTGKELDAVARDYIDQRGYGDAFSHGLGHGVGLRVHEAPSASRTSEDVLAPGQTLTIEPGIYLEEWGGVRVEDVILFTDAGYEILTGTAKKASIDTNS